MAVLRAVPMALLTVVNWALSLAVLSVGLTVGYSAQQTAGRWAAKWVLSWVECLVRYWADVRALQRVVLMAVKTAALLVDS